MNATVQPDLLADAAQLDQEPQAERDLIDRVGAAPQKPPKRDFWEESADSIIFETQPRTAVYVNPHNSVVIRQEGTSDDGDDQFIHFPPQNIDHLIRMLQHARDEAYELQKERES